MIGDFPPGGGYVLFSDINPSGGEIADPGGIFRTLFDFWTLFPKGHLP